VEERNGSFSSILKGEPLDKEAFTEKRKQNRFRVQEYTFAELRNNSITLGVIKDISRDGLAVNYYSYDELLHGSIMVERFFKGRVGHVDDYHLKGAPVRIIWDSEIDNHPPFSTITIRRCGLQFTDITPSQILHVDRLIEKYGL